MLRFCFSICFLEVKKFNCFALIVIGFHITVKKSSAINFKQILGDQSVSLRLFTPNFKHLVLQILFLT